MVKKLVPAIFQILFIEAMNNVFCRIVMLQRLQYISDLQLSYRVCR